MGQVLLTIPDDNISMFLDFVKNLEFIQKIEKVKDDNKPLTKEDWVKPGRPATDEEFEKMIADAETEEKAGLGMAAEEAEEYVTKRIEEWKKKRK
jgi:hypothetical protein